MRREDVFLEVRKLIVSELDLNVAAHDLQEADLLYGPLIRLDSLGSLRLLEALEDRFGVRVGDEGPPVLETVQDVVVLVGALRAAKG